MENNLDTHDLTSFMKLLVKSFVSKAFYINFRYNNSGVSKCFLEQVKSKILVPLVGP